MHIGGGFCGVIVLDVEREIYRKRVGTADLST